MIDSYETQITYAQNLLRAYLEVKDYFSTFVRAAELLCPDVMRMAPESTGRSVFAELIRLEQWYWDEEVLCDDGSGFIRCDNLIVTVCSDGSLELAVYDDVPCAEESFAQAKYLIEDAV